MVTVAPAAHIRRARCEPIKPKPPVISTRAPRNFAAGIILGLREICSGEGDEQPPVRGAEPPIFQAVPAGGQARRLTPMSAKSSTQRAKTAPDKMQPSPLNYVRLDDVLAASPI